MHKINFLWKLHRVHHSDTDFDTSTAIRFYPLEILFSSILKVMIVIAFNISLETFLIFEIILNFMALFNHSNIKLPHAVDKVTRFFIATPDYHRIHHSLESHEMNSNFSTALTMWDFLFRSYISKSKNDLREDKIGLEDFRKPIENRVDKLITQPFS